MLTAIRTTFATDYADQSDSEELVIPEDLTELGDQELTELHTQAVEAFEAVMGDGSDLTDEQLEVLEGLAGSVDELRAELDTRNAAKSERTEKANELAARIRPQDAEEATEGDESEAADDSDVADGEAVDGEELAADDEQTETVEGEVVTAGAGQQPARRGMRVNLSGLRNKRPAQLPTAPEAQVIFAAPNNHGYAMGQPMTKLDMAKAVDRRLSGMNVQSYSTAAKRSQKLSERFQIAQITRSFSDDLIVKDSDASSAIEAAVDQSKLSGNSLVAAGGWCAPSETLYDLCDISEATNLLSVPEIQVNRGGIMYPTAPDYSTIYGETGFCFTEQDDIDGNYAPGASPDDPNVEGPKPCFHVPCPEFQEARLEVCGVCITAGLLQARGYPEAIQNYIDLTLNAHAHRMSARSIADMVGDSEAVAFPSNMAGAAAPILSAIELQATHYRAVNRMGDNAVLEAVFPLWTRGAIRSDLSRRLGVDLVSVSDARIMEWFRNAGINAQFVIDWQDISTTSASAFTAWPSELTFLLYAAGTWVRGVSDSITFENVYDSVGLGTNDFTALFTEDPYLLVRRCFDSRAVTVPICADGSTHAGVEIACDGTAAAA